MFNIFRKNCCNLDVHKTWIYACIGITNANNITTYTENRFSSFSKVLKSLLNGLNHSIAMMFGWNLQVNIGFLLTTFSRITALLPLPIPNTLILKYDV